MFQNVLQESWVYQEIGQEFLERGREEGLEQGRQKRVQGLRQTLVSFLLTKFPELIALANQQSKSIHDPEVLQMLLTQLFIAQTVEDARQILLEADNQ